MSIFILRYLYSIILQYCEFSTSYNRSRRRKGTHPSTLRAHLQIGPRAHQNTARASSAGASQYNNRSEADDLDSLSSFNVRIEYYRSVEYCLKWEGPMHLRHFSKLPKGSKKSPRKKSSPDENVLKHKMVEKKQKTGKRRTKSSNGVVNAKKKHREILDLISSPHETDGVVEEEEGAIVEILDKGLDEWNDDCASVCSSISSGPSFYYPARLSQVRCSACQKLYQKARRMKAPLKNKLLDNDPKSLTCDQWVLIKSRRLTRMPNAGGKLLICLQRVKKRLRGKKVKQHEQPPACSRPHIYLQRNLRRRVPLKQERKTNKRRKRTRDDSQGSRVAKQQRLQSSVRSRHISSVNDSRHSASAQNGVNEVEDYSDQDSDSAGPSTVINPTTTELPSTQTKSQRFQRGFRDLLFQLRGNSSMIVREPH